MYFARSDIFLLRLEAIGGHVGTYTKTMIHLTVVVMVIVIVIVIVIVNYCHLCHSSDFLLAPCVNRFTGKIRHFLEVYQDKDVAFLDLQKRCSSFAIQHLICVSPSLLVPQACYFSLPS